MTRDEDMKRKILMFSACTAKFLQSTHVIQAPHVSGYWSPVSLVN